MQITSSFSHVLKGNLRLCWILIFLLHWCQQNHKFQPNLYFWSKVIWST